MRCMKRSLGPVLVLIVAGLVGGCGASARTETRPAATSDIPTSTAATTIAMPSSGNPAIDAELATIDRQLGTMSGQLGTATAGITADEGDPSQ
ncbi:MAG: hypothetical protein JWO37_2535 [Acidimicrobiales bacterium]|jgi:hypothetical protein|nr:hypothetical protein [Acidimicrobiales bacterium]